MKFSDIPGHESVKQQLRNLVDTNCMPHALLLEGDSGIGKMALARALAQYIHCTGRRPGDTDPCGRCPSCLQHQSFNHTDTYYCYPVVKTDGQKTAPVSADYFDEWKKMLGEVKYMDFDRWAATFNKVNAKPVIYVTESAELIRMLSLTARNSNYKIVIMWLPERMNPETANKLLKLIEEPHPDTIFIAVSDSPALILGTIYSRMQRITVKRLADDIVAAELVATGHVDPATARAVAHNAEGSMTRAMRLLTRTGADAEHFDLFVRLMRLAYQRRVADLRAWATELAALGREREIKFYTYAARLVRENFILNFNMPQINYMNDDENSFSRNFARFINERNVEKIIGVINEAITDIAGNANGKIVNFDVALKIILLIKN